MPGPGFKELQRIFGESAAAIEQDGDIYRVRFTCDETGDPQWDEKIRGVLDHKIMMLQADMINKLGLEAVAMDIIESCNLTFAISDIEKPETIVRLKSIASEDLPIPEPPSYYLDPEREEDADADDIPPPENIPVEIDHCAIVFMLNNATKVKWRYDEERGHYQTLSALENVKEAAFALARVLGDESISKPYEHVGPGVSSIMVIPGNAINERTMLKLGRDRLPPNFADNFKSVPQIT